MFCLEVPRLGFGCAVGNSSGQWGVMEVVSEVESGVVWLRWWWWWGCVSANARWEAGLGVKSDKSERNGSIWGAPCQTAVEGDGGWWWDEVDEV